MNFEINTNSLINDIMVNNDSAVMLFAPAGTGKTDFLTELGGRYRTVFWFNAVMDDMSLFTYTFINKVLGTEESASDLKNKLNQLLYCKSEFNDDNVAISAVLNYIGAIKGDCLMVFERMECLPQDFDVDTLERLICYSPDNLKIVISSDVFLNLNYMKFGKRHPKLIDETVLIPRFDRPDSCAFLKDVTEEDKAFLVYISDLVAIRKEFVSQIYPRGVEVLTYLSRKEGYITTRDARYFRMTTNLRTYLSGLKNEYSAINEKLNFVDVKGRYAQYLVDIGNNFTALALYFELGNYVKIDEVLGIVIHDERNDLLKLRDLAYSRCSLNFEQHDELPFFKIFHSYIIAHNGQMQEAINSLEQCVKYFRAQKDVWSEVVSLVVLARFASRSPQFTSDYIALIKDALKYYSVGNERALYGLYCTSVSLRRELSIPISDFDAKINDKIVQNTFMYIKGEEELALAYFDLGNYKRALEITDAIKAYLPWYVVPHTFIPFRYYQGDVEKAAAIAQNALNFAESNGITKDISLLYTTLGMVDLHFGRIDEGLAKYDKAVYQDSTNDTYVKFYNIGQRCMAYAKHKDAYYAKEIAHYNLKYCEINHLEYVNIMQIALSFAYLKLGDKEKAYYYATLCVQNSKSRSTNWLLGMAIATAYMLDNGDLKDATTLVKNILKSSENYGMEMILIDYYDDIFDGLVSFAKQNNIETEYVDRLIVSARYMFNKKIEPEKLKIGMFGDVQISVGGKDVLWKTRKSKELFLHYLLARDVGIDRNIIIDMLWKDYLYESAINNLKTTNNIIRNTLKAANIEFNLDYLNSRYILKLKNVDNDYNEYYQLMQRYKDESNLQNMSDIMRELLKIYKGDFAEDIFYPEFQDERKNLKQEMIICLLKLIRALAQNEEYMEAKGFLTSLIVLDKQNDYTHMVLELDSHINLTE